VSFDVTLKESGDGETDSSRYTVQIRAAVEDTTHNNNNNNNKSLKVT